MHRHASHHHHHYETAAYSYQPQTTTSPSGYGSTNLDGPTLAGAAIASVLITLIFVFVVWRKVRKWLRAREARRLAQLKAAEPRPPKPPPPPPPPGASIKERLWGNIWRPYTAGSVSLGASRLLPDDHPFLKSQTFWTWDENRGPHLARLNGGILSYQGEGHLLTIAAPGTGKSSGPVATNLMAYEGSIIVTDPKGELATLTAHLRAAKGQDVYVVDPWGIVPDHAIPGGVRASLNPLDLIPGAWIDGEPVEGPQSADDADMLADAILVEGSKSEPHWDQTAKALISGVLMLAALDPVWTAPRTLPAVYDLLTLPEEALRVFLMAATKSPIRAGAAEINTFLSKADREASGVKSTVDKNLRFLRTDAMRAAFGGSTFSWAKVKQRPSTVFLCIPPARLTTHSQFLRLMFSTAIKEMETLPPPTDQHGRPWHNVLFLMDEFANLGRVEKITQAYAVMRGYGIKLWAFVQDANQLHTIYGDQWQTFVGCAGVVQAFGTRDVFTSKYLSELSGDFTQSINVTSSNTTQTSGWSSGQSTGGHGSTSSGENSSTSTSTNTSVNHSTTPLLYPSDFRQLSVEDQILIIDGLVTVQKKNLWYRDEVYRSFIDNLLLPAPALQALPSPTPTPLPAPAVAVGAWGYAFTFSQGGVVITSPSSMMH